MRLRLVAVAVALALFASWVVLCVRDGVNLPFMDQWHRPLVPLYHLRQGTLSFVDDLFVQHNESRKVIPTGISLALATVLGRFDTHVELAVGLVVWAALAFAVARLARACRMPAPAGAVLALVFVALSGSARTTYFHLYSITFERLIPELALVGSLALLLGRGLTWATALGCAAFLAAGQFSHSNGILACLLVPGFALLAFRRSLGPWLVLVGCGALSSLAYFWTYTRPPGHSPLAAIFAQPLAAWRHFFLRFLGNPISGDVLLATISAATVLVIFTVASWFAWRREPRPALAWITVGLYSIGEAMVATISRLPMSLDHALRGDYLIHAVYLYLAAAALLLLAWPARRTVVAGALIAASTVALVSLFTPHALADRRGTHELQLAARACAREGRTCDAANPWLSPTPEYIRSIGQRARAAGVWGVP